MDKLKIGFVGIGQRGSDLLCGLSMMEDVEVLAVCDEYEDRTEAAVKMVKENTGVAPIGTTNYHEVLKIDDIQAVVIATAWELHVEIAVNAMRAGKDVGVEVGGAYSIDDCWQLVRASEQTGKKCMMLENCCYAQNEMMCLNLAKKGLFGEIVHCEGGYRHDLRNEIIKGEEIRHYRLRNYSLRCCDNYPTHQLGPIAKILNINNGNRMLSLVSVASKAVGLKDYAKEYHGEEHHLSHVNYAQGDVVTTIIKCAGGETIKLTLETSTPRPYSRGFIVSGTKGCFQEDNNSLFLDSDTDQYVQTYDEWNFDWQKSWNNAEEYKKKYDHPLWKKCRDKSSEEGHGSMDHFVLRAFVESILEGKDFPIDVYDIATWMSISTLSEDSIAMGGMPVAIPDFTNGKWIKGRKQSFVEEYRLDKIPKLD